MASVRDLRISPRRVLPARLLSVRFSRSSGPGGQHVQKVATKVDLRLDLDGAAEILGPMQVARIRAKLASRLDAKGRLRIVAGERRERARNLESALVRMERLLRGALARPRRRTPTRPTRASQERRLVGKRRRGRIKRWRSERPRED